MRAILALAAAVLATSSPQAAPGGGKNAAGAPASAPAAASAVPNAAVSPEAYRKEIEAWRAERAAGLKSANGWLTLVGLFWLDEGENRFGSDPGNRVVLPRGKAPAVAGSLVRRGESVSVRAEPAAGLTSDGRPVTSLTLKSDAQGKPTVLRIGSVSFHIVKRGDRLGVRVKDSQSPALASFRGLDDFPIQPAWRVEARFEPSQPPKKIPIANVLGMVEDQPSPGAVVFEHDGKTYRLDALSGGDDGSLFLLFADHTNSHETYGAGRFLDTDPPRDGKVVVDFNKAYNPPCAFTSYATCPLPPRQNRLPLRIEAGEKKYGQGHPG